MLLPQTQRLIAKHIYLDAQSLILYLPHAYQASHPVLLLLDCQSNVNRSSAIVYLAGLHLMLLQIALPRVKIDLATTIQQQKPTKNVLPSCLDVKRMALDVWRATLPARLFSVTQQHASNTKPPIMLISANLELNHLLPVLRGVVMMPAI